MKKKKKKKKTLRYQRRVFFFFFFFFFFIEKCNELFICIAGTCIYMAIRWGIAYMVTYISNYNT
eukprot:NODE_2111_length_985_cov_62.179487_g129_i17.p4 GENE.NODE_2111_length_985_cov_62.179487_g129_i17~~NODE_2111_length_985_cov_62.179487_g129_i17.p4  ORF type:complete len:64 (+),score=39.39 NODE_2111_length_985_cov_62.179487_g129_i17:317-508(+)